MGSATLLCAASGGSTASVAGAASIDTRRDLVRYAVSACRPPRKVLEGRIRGSLNGERFYLSVPAKQRDKRSEHS